MTVRRWIGLTADVGIAVGLLAACSAEPSGTTASQGSFSSCATLGTGCPSVAAGNSGTLGDGATLSPAAFGADSEIPSSSSVSSGSSPEVSSASAGASGANTSSADVGTAETGVPGIPCDVANIVGAQCTGCHGSEPTFGAPMPLAALADFQAPASSDPSRKVFEVVSERIDPTDVAKRMPPTSLPALHDDAKAALQAWIAAGALGVDGGCEITETSLVPTDEATATRSSTSGGAHIMPIEYDDPDMQCYKFLAHASGSEQPYSAAPGEAYINFTFAAPWQGTVYQRAIRIALDDNSKVIHHWLLFKLTGRGSPGAVAVGSGAHPDGILLHGWAPGASPVYLDKDVGVKLEGDVGYMLEAHYYNSGVTAGPDQSGAEICVTPTAPEHLAELSWLGTDAIVGTNASGTCSPNIREPVHLLVAQPHMHLKGRHMKVVINHQDQTQEVIHDEDFAFENQRYYVLNSILNPGETITTTCSYNGVATFGTSTNSEMCYFFTLHWPAGALRTTGIGTVLHGANSCL